MGFFYSFICVFFLLCQSSFTLSQDIQKPDNALDGCTIDYQFTDDKNKHLIGKTTSEGLTITYSYLSGTDHPIAELHRYRGKIQERFFHHYDENGLASMIIEDDGSSPEEEIMTDVTFRRIKKIEREKNFGDPAFGKPLQVEEGYVADNKFIFLKKMEFIYDAKGCEIKQKVYDSKNALNHEILKAYDQRQRLIQETNALGHSTRYAYDAHNNKIMEELVGSGRKISYEYDSSHRLICKKDQRGHGEDFTSTYAYNTFNQVVAEKDGYDNETTYVYDSSGRQTQCVKPYIQDAQDAYIKPTSSTAYHPSGHLVSRTNENGETIQTSYHVNGLPHQITYPDGAIERFAYSPCGRLLKKWMSDGTSFAYLYDPKGHLLQENFLDREGKSLKEIFYEYKGPLLKTKKDADGLMTSYRYDAAGRMVEEKRGALQTITYKLDDFGNPLVIDREGKLEITCYDPMGRPLTKQWKDRQGTLYRSESYEYDIQDNISQKVVCPFEDGVAVYRFRYDPDGNLLEEIDPLRHRMEYLLDHRHMNGLGQHVKLKTILDPLGRSIHETSDVFGRLANRALHNGPRQFSCTHFNYDAAGRLSRQRAVVMDDGLPIREYAVLRHFNNRGMIASETEMPQGKTTGFVHDSMGRLLEKEKPDGVKLSYLYDPLGRLLTLSSSDQTVDFHYTYDERGDLVQIEDRIHGMAQKRGYDQNHRLIEEEIFPGVSLRYAYDAHNRVTRLELPDGSSIAYFYDAFHLRKIERTSSGKLTYAIECQKYDLLGNLLVYSTPACRVETNYDITGRIASIRSPQWECELGKFDAAGNLLQMKQNDPSGWMKGTFTYDHFDYLSTESTIFTHSYAYDSLGNCLKKNERPQKISESNQLLSDGESDYQYDPNGNLIGQTYPPAFYGYDALDRLVSCEKEGRRTTFIYDAFGRCLQLTDAVGTKLLLHHGMQEMGSIDKSGIVELRVVHPEPDHEQTFAIELKGETFFPIQDAQGSICALQKSDGSMAQWIRYFAFGGKTIYGVLPKGAVNPWRFANKREVEGLVLFPERIYNPAIRRWQTPDPNGFKEGLNGYCFKGNNPFSK